MNIKGDEKYKGTLPIIPIIVQNPCSEVSTLENCEKGGPVLNM